MYEKSDLESKNRITQLKLRRKPLTIREYEADFRQHASDLQLVERVFQGGIDGNQLRAALWPLIFGLVQERGRFVRRKTPVHQTNGHSNGFHRNLSPAGRTLNHDHHHHSNHQFARPSNGHQLSQVSSSKLPRSRVGLTNSSSSPAFLSAEASRRRAAVVSANKPQPSVGASATDKFVYIDHEHNLRRWRDLESQYRSYEAQWKSIQPEQELRFSVFRERRALIERDVVRSDRSHPFYANNSDNLSALTCLLMTYMMYDFDIGYLQGMSDIAAPILYVYQGDPVKSFWVFAEVMKLFRRNFETSQKTIHFQLNCLYRLVKLKDVKLAKHLRENECSNCFFVFRSIVCQFKRELMKQTSVKARPTDAANGTTGRANNENKGGLSDGLASRSSSSSSSCSSMSASGEDDDEDDECGCSEHENDDCSAQVERNYNRVLNLWDTIWCVQRRHELIAKSKCVHTFTIANARSQLRAEQPKVVYTKETFYSSFDPNQADVPRFELTETEKFVLSLCLALIRRERNQILANQMDASEIHQHFINPPGLAEHFDAFVEQAYEVYEYLNTDCDLKLLVRGADELAGEAHTLDLSAPISGADDQLSSTADTYELLKDYLIISPTAYNISMTSLNNLQKGCSPLSSHNGKTPQQVAQLPHTISRREPMGGRRCGVSLRSWDHFLNSETLQ